MNETSQDLSPFLRLATLAKKPFCVYPPGARLYCAKAGSLANVLSEAHLRFHSNWDALWLSARYPALNETTINDARLRNDLNPVEPQANVEA